uniref:Uncharacterized protein n=1 Tax=Oryza brachyantha TaxID=4533 RepID=J3N1A4_ORYBR
MGRVRAWGLSPKAKTGAKTCPAPDLDQGLAIPYLILERGDSDEVSNMIPLRIKSDTVAVTGDTSMKHQFCRLDEKVVVVTGAASGIGKATAAEFVKSDTKVIITNVEDPWRMPSAMPSHRRSEASYTHCDVMDEAQVTAVDLAVARHSHHDIIINKAGVVGSLAQRPLSSLDLANFDAVMAINA